MHITHPFNFLRIYFFTLEHFVFKVLQNQKSFLVLWTK